MLVQDTQLYKFILDSGLVSREELDDARAEADRSSKHLGDMLVSQGKITLDNLRRIHAYILGMPFVDLKGRNIAFDILSVIPEPVARTRSIVAFNKSGPALEVAMLDVRDLLAIDFLKKTAGLKIVPHVTDAESIKDILVQYQKNLKSIFGDAIQKETASLSQMTEEELGNVADHMPAARIVDTLMRHAIIQNASDIHIEPLEGQMLVRYRINGRLHDAIVLPKHAGPSIAARIKLLSGIDLAQNALPQDGRFKVEMHGEQISFRVSTLPTLHGEKIVMRLLREHISGFTLEYLHYHGEPLEHMHEALTAGKGLILCTGPGGSGKTTTLYTMLDILNQPDVNISTVENPIEYQIARINQTMVNPEIGFSYASGLRTIMRQDPDIIMAGELPDHETAALAVNAALTDRLVLSAMSAGSAAGAVSRLIGMKIEPTLLASTLSIVIGQRLVRRLGDDKIAYTLTASDLAKLGKVAELDKVLDALKRERAISATDTWQTIPFYKNGKAAHAAPHAAGRVGIHEVLKVSPAIRELITRKAPATAIDAQARKEGMLSLIEDGIFKCVQGLTSIDEVLRVATE